MMIARKHSFSLFWRELERERAYDWFEALKLIPFSDINMQKLIMCFITDNEDEHLVCSVIELKRIIKKSYVHCIIEELAS